MVKDLHSFGRYHPVVVMSVWHSQDKVLSHQLVEFTAITQLLKHCPVLRRIMVMLAAFDFLDDCKFVFLI